MRTTPRRTGRRAPGLAKARRGAIVGVGPRAALDRGAEEAIFRHARILSEGEPKEAQGATQFFGSTMVTVDLVDLARDVRGLHSPQGRANLLARVEGSVRVHLRLLRLARADAWSRCPDGVLGTAQVEVRARIQDGKLLLDVDLEAPLERTLADATI